MKIGFIGYGNMAQAIARGLLKQGKYQLSASAPSLVSGINQEGLITDPDNKRIASSNQVLILSVKPDTMAEVLQEITPVLPADCLLISVASGLTLSWFSHFIAPEQALVRSMPNLPAKVGLAATPLLANAQTSATERALAEAIFSSIGISTWVKEDSDIDSFVALSGSGPAYVFLFMNAMIETAIAMGIDEQTARLFALQTVEGSLAMAKTEQCSLTDLRAKVTSKGGTTAAAVTVLEPQFSQLIHKAMQAAALRAQEQQQESFNSITTTR